MSQHFKTFQEASAYVGGFSKPSKMPCYSINLPAFACNVGSGLRNVKGSVCHTCYGCKGRYRFSNVRNALTRRLEALKLPYWKEAMTFALGKLEWFRFHDVGDLQGEKHFADIVAIAEKCPKCKIWLPTKETAVVKSFIEKGGKIPKNLNVRLSCPMIDGKNVAIKSLATKLGLTVASVSSGRGKPVNCHAYLTDGKCGSCRACWDKKVFEIVYRKH